MESSQYSVNWSSYVKDISHGFNLLQQQEEFVDMTLAADGHYVKVHQSLVSLVSPFIKELLMSMPRTSHHPVIFLDIAYEMLCYILEYVYKGEVIVPDEKLDKFLSCAKKLHIKGIGNLNRIKNTETENDDDTVLEIIDHIPYPPENQQGLLDKNQVAPDQQKHVPDNQKHVLDDKMQLEPSNQNVQVDQGHVPPNQTLVPVNQVQLPADQPAIQVQVIADQLLPVEEQHVLVFGGIVPADQGHVPAELSANKLCFIADQLLPAVEQHVQSDKEYVPGHLKDAPADKHKLPVNGVDVTIKPKAKSLGKSSKRRRMKKKHELKKTGKVVIDSAKKPKTIVQTIQEARDKEQNENIPETLTSLLTPSPEALESVKKIDSAIAFQKACQYAIENVHLNYMGIDEDLPMCPKNDVEVPPMIPVNDIEVPPMCPENDIGVPPMLPENDTEVPPMCPENDIGVPPMLPENDTEVPPICPENDIEVPPMFPENDIEVPTMCPENDIKVPPMFPENDIEVPPTCPENDIEVPETVTENSQTHAHFESDAAYCPQLNDPGFETAHDDAQNIKNIDLGATPITHASANVETIQNDTNIEYSFHLTHAISKLEVIAQQTQQNLDLNSNQGTQDQNLPRNDVVVTNNPTAISSDKSPKKTLNLRSRKNRKIYCEDGVKVKRKLKRRKREIKQMVQLVEVYIEKPKTAVQILQGHGDKEQKNDIPETLGPDHSASAYQKVYQDAIKNFYSNYTDIDDVLLETPKIIQHLQVDQEHVPPNQGLVSVNQVQVPTEISAIQVQVIADQHLPVEDQCMPVYGGIVPEYHQYVKSDQELVEINQVTVPADQTANQVHVIADQLLPVEKQYVPLYGGLVPADQGRVPVNQVRVPAELSANKVHIIADQLLPVEEQYVQYGRLVPAYQQHMHSDPKNLPDKLKDEPADKQSLPVNNVDVTKNPKSKVKSRPKKRKHELEQTGQVLIASAKKLKKVQIVQEARDEEQNKNIPETFRPEASESVDKIDSSSTFQKAYQDAIQNIYSNYMGIEEDMTMCPENDIEVPETVSENSQIHDQFHSDAHNYCPQPNDRRITLESIHDDGQNITNIDLGATPITHSANAGTVQQNDTNIEYSFQPTHAISKLEVIPQQRQQNMDLNSNQGTQDPNLPRIDVNVIKIPNVKSSAISSGKTPKKVCNLKIRKDKRNFYCVVDKDGSKVKRRPKQKHDIEQIGQVVTVSAKKTKTTVQIVQEATYQEQKKNKPETLGPEASESVEEIDSANAFQEAFRMDAIHNIYSNYTGIDEGMPMCPENDIKVPETVTENSYIHEQYQSDANCCPQPNDQRITLETIHDDGQNITNIDLGATLITHASANAAETVQQNTTNIEYSFLPTDAISKLEVIAQQIQKHRDFNSSQGTQDPNNTNFNIESVPVVEESDNLDETSVDSYSMLDTAGEDIRDLLLYHENSEIYQTNYGKEQTMDIPFFELQSPLVSNVQNLILPTQGEGDIDITLLTRDQEISTTAPDIVLQGPLYEYSNTALFTVDSGKFGELVPNEPLKKQCSNIHELLRLTEESIMADESMYQESNTSNEPQIEASVSSVVNTQDPMSEVNQSKTIPHIDLTQADVEISVVEPSDDTQGKIHSLLWT